MLMRVFLIWAVINASLVLGWKLVYLARHDYPLYVSVPAWHHVVQAVEAGLILAWALVLLINGR